MTPNTITPKINIKEDQTKLYLKEGHYLNSLSKEILDNLSQNHRLLVKASPGTGKTSLISDWFASREDIPFQKIVFMSPLILIQDQFKSAVNDKRGKIDLELNYKSKEFYQSNDRNITSTYKSLWKIEDVLTTNDLIVVDEAHSLLNAFRNGKLVDVYSETALILTRTRAKILFLSATPGETLQDVFKFGTLEISNKVKPSELEFQNGNGSYLEFAIWFANRAINRQGKDKLNLIYLNSKKKIDKVNLILEKEDYKCLILHSDVKNDTAYEELVESASVDKNVQFLLTTSFISAGANILNDNMGEALIFNNHDPIDIFQFSKRFRNGMNMQVTLVNPTGWDKQTYPSKKRLNKEIKTTRSAYNRVLDNLAEMDAICFDSTYHNDGIGTKKDLMVRTMTRLLIEEARHKEKLKERFKKTNDLFKALKYLNFEPRIGFPLKVDSSIDYNEIAKAEEKKKIQKLIKKFEEHLPEYLAAIKEFAEKDKDYVIREQYEKYKSELNTNALTVREDIYEDVNNHFFIRKIIQPFLTYFPFFNLDTKTVDFLKSVPSDIDREAAQIQLYFNNTFNSHYIQDEHSGKPRKNPSLNFQELSSKEKHAVKFIDFTVELFEIAPYYNYKELRNRLRNNIKIENSSLVNDFPFEGLEISETKSKDGYELTNIHRTFAKNLFLGIFYIDPKRKQRNLRGLPNNIYIPYQSLEKSSSKRFKNLNPWKFSEFKYQKRGVIKSTYFTNSELIVESFSRNYFT